jgi:hypothetical protein
VEQEEGQPMKVYISGPITGTNDYMERFDRVALDVFGRYDCTVINPAYINSMLPNDTTHAEYMRTSIAMLSMCDTIYMMRGWENSKGCKIEYAYAKKNGIKVIYENGAYQPKSDIDVDGMIKRLDKMVHLHTKAGEFIPKKGVVEMIKEACQG